jgi:ribosomal protein S18 acetylase RimI-like enzyme
MESPMKTRIRLLRPGEEAMLANVADEVFDNPVDPALAAAFLADPRHHLVAALDGDLVVGFVSAVDYIHPDKPAELWINETGVAPTYQGQGIAKQMLAAMLDHGRTLRCGTAWVLTDTTNIAANALYRAAGGVEGVDSDPGNRSMTGYVFNLDGAGSEK